jgi:hypothetical protein
VEEEPHSPHRQKTSPSEIKTFTLAKLFPSENRSVNLTNLFLSQNNNSRKPGENGFPLLPMQLIANSQNRSDLGEQGGSCVESREELLNKLLQDYCVEDSALGAIQIGSIAKGYDDESSDVDLEVIVTEEKYAAIEKRFQKFIHTDTYDLMFMTLAGLQKVADSEIDEDHWNYQDAAVLLDKTGTIEKILKDITRYDAASRVTRLKKYYLAYWNNTLGSFSCLKHRNDWGSKIYAAFAIQELIRLLFNINHRWSPRLQWAFKELPSLEKKPSELENQIRNILEKPDSNNLGKLWNDTIGLMQEENYSWINRPEEIL